MSKNKKGRKKYDYRKKAVLSLTGVVMKWSVVDPLGEKPEILNTNYKHKNCVYRLVGAEIKGMIKTAMAKLRMLYRVTVEVEYAGDNNKAYFRSATLGIDGIFYDAEDDYMDAIENIFNESNMSQYVNTHVTIEILGCGSALKAVQS